MEECVLTSALISPNCGSVCEEGETISMSGTYTGDCRVADFLQIDASGGGCELSYQYGDMQGVSSTVSGGGMDGGTFVASWTVPEVTQACSGKTVSAIGTGLYDGGPPGTGNQIWYTESVSGSFTFEIIDSEITVASSPILGSGYAEVDSNPIITAQTFSWTPSSTHTLSANSPVVCSRGCPIPCNNDCQEVFVSWSDGEAQEHDITIPSTPTIYSASYQKQYYLNMEDTPSGRGRVLPSDGWINDLESVSISAIADPGYGFMSWSGSGLGSYSGSLNPAPITMNGAITQTANFAIDECDSINDVRCDDGNVCTIDSCDRPADPDSVCINDAGAADGLVCGTSACPGDSCTDSILSHYDDATCDLVCSGGSCELSCTCPETLIDCSQAGNWDGDSVQCNCDCPDYSTLFFDVDESEAENNCADGMDNDCDGKTDSDDFNCPLNTMNFAGNLFYSTGLPVVNSLVRVIIRNETFNYEKMGYNETDETGHFSVTVHNIRTNMMDSDFDLAIYVVGEVEAIYECHYDRQSGLCS